MSLQAYKRRDSALQLAFVATLAALGIELALSIILGFVRPDIFGTGGEGILLQNTSGAWNIPLVTGLVILAIFIIGTAVSPLLRPKASDLHPARAVIYTLTFLSLIYITLTYLLLPIWTGHIPALQSAYWPVSISLATGIGFIITSQPGIAERAPKPRKDKTENSQESVREENAETS